MSKGMQEKLQLVLVMCRKARLYLLDEPLGGVDPAARAFILDFIMKNYAENASIILSTHLINDLERIFDRALMIGNGKKCWSTLRWRRSMPPAKRWRKRLRRCSLMLGKLIKHEFQSSAHSVMNIYIAAAVALAAMLLSYAVKVTWVGVIGSIALIIIGLICVVITLVAVVTNFNRTLYGAEGYLSYTLPVKSSALLASKAIVSFVWVLLSYIFMIATFFIVFAYVQSSIGEEVGSMMDMLMATGWPTLHAGDWEGACRNGGGHVHSNRGVCIRRVFCCDGGECPPVPAVWDSHGAGGFFFLIYIVMQVLLYVATTYIPLTVVINTAGKIVVSFSTSMAAKGAQEGMVIGIAGFVIELLIASGLFVGTNALMKTKINLK